MDQTEDGGRAQVLVDNLVFISVILWLVVSEL